MAALVQVVGHEAFAIVRGGQHPHACAQVDADGRVDPAAARTRLDEAGLDHRVDAERGERTVVPVGRGLLRQRGGHIAKMGAAQLGGGEDLVAQGGLHGPYLHRLREARLTRSCRARVRRFGRAGNAAHQAGHAADAEYQQQGRTAARAAAAPAPAGQAGGKRAPRARERAFPLAVGKAVEAQRRRLFGRDYGHFAQRRLVGSVGRSGIQGRASDHSDTRDQHQSRGALHGSLLRDGPVDPVSATARAHSAGRRRRNGR